MKRGEYPWDYERWPVNGCPSPIYAPDAPMPPACFPGALPAVRSHIAWACHDYVLAQVRRRKMEGPAKDRSLSDEDWLRKHGA